MLIKQQIGEMVFFIQPEWDIPHGFFTRQKGVSSGLYQGLNTGIGSNDDKDAVLANQTLIAQVILQNQQADYRDIYLLYQFHSNKVISTPFDDTHIYEADGRIKGDALVSNKNHANYQQNKLMGIMTADCVPVLFYDKIAGVTAAAHAGWKGAVDGVLLNSLASMQAQGAALENIQIALGPAIQQKSYQVGVEFYQNFISRSADFAQFFVADTAINEAYQQKYLFDLLGFIGLQMQHAGIAPQHINTSTEDTCTNETLFFSYRRSCLKQQPDYGRNLSVIAC